MGLVINFDNWRISTTGNDLHEGENDSKRVDVIGDFPAEYSYMLHIRVRGLLVDVVLLTPTDNGVGAVLDSAILSYGNDRYEMQVWGLNGITSRATNKITLTLSESITGEEQWHEVPYAFMQIEARIADMNAHPPIPDADTKKWKLWNPEAQEYQLSDYDVPEVASVTVDTTLSVEGAAADAKAVGDALYEKASNDQLEDLTDDFNDKLSEKVDVVSGKGLSTNDYTDADKTKVADSASEDYVDGEINDLQGQIDALISKSDVVDVVGTYAELTAYDTSTLGDNDVVKVLDDSTHSNQRSYYRWVITGGVGAWVYVGSEAVGYTKAQTDTYLNAKLDKTGDGKDVTATFVQAGSRNNIQSGEKLSVMLGKIRKWFADLKTVAFTNSFNDLDDKPIMPVVNDAVLTITQGGVTKGTFSANASINKTVELDAGGGGGSATTDLFIYWESIVGTGRIALDKNGTAVSVADFISAMQSGDKIRIGENNDTDSESSGFSNYRYKITDATTASLAFDAESSFSGSDRTIIISSANGYMSGYQDIAHDALADYLPLPEGGDTLIVTVSVNIVPLVGMTISNPSHTFAQILEAHNAGKFVELQFTFGRADYRIPFVKYFDDNAASPVDYIIFEGSDGSESGGYSVKVTDADAWTIRTFEYAKKSDLTDYRTAAAQDVIDNGKEATGNRLGAVNPSADSIATGKYYSAAAVSAFIDKLIPHYVSAHSWGVGDYCTFSGTIYKCNTAHNNVQWTSAYWDAVPDFSKAIKDYVDAHSGGSDNIFIVTGVSYDGDSVYASEAAPTFAEILTAHQAGKAVFLCVDTDEAVESFQLPLLCHDTGVLVFGGIDKLDYTGDGHSNIYISVDEDDAWAVSYDDYAKKDDLPQNVSELTNDSGYLTLSTLPIYNGGVE